MWGYPRRKQGGAGLSLQVRSAVLNVLASLILLVFRRFTGFPFYPLPFQNLSLNPYSIIH